jgi:hypothetical protein
MFLIEIDLPKPIDGWLNATTVGLLPELRPSDLFNIYSWLARAAARCDNLTINLDHELPLNHTCSNRSTNNFPWLAAILCLH